MASAGPYNATLGQSWRSLVLPVLCSTCGAEIDAARVPLHLFDPRTELRWFYCLDCGERMIVTLQEKMTAQTKRPE